jgi:hypothetical protein
MIILKDGKYFKIAAPYTSKKTQTSEIRMDLDQSWKENEGFCFH